MKNELKITIRKLKNNVPALSMSSGKDDTFILQICVPRELGITQAMLISSNLSSSFEWKKLESGFDVYSLDFYEFIETTDEHFTFSIQLKSDCTIYYPKTSAVEIYNKDISYYITSNAQESEKFIFTLSERSRCHCFKGAVYHIFIDRFNKASPTIRNDSRYNDDWDNGIPEYAQNPGDFLENNTHFGGNFEGIEKKLEYLESLSVECIYLSPVNKAFSNHKYDVGSYFEIDENFGGEEKLKSLIEACHMRGIKVIFDSVFNHTGDRSKYFNKFATYNSIGAYQSKNSEFYDWYSFSSYPDKYDCWWGVKCLPAIKKGNGSFIDYICKEGGVIDYYMSLGADGLRLDVADELPIFFIKKIKEAVKRNRENGIIVGEVWENAARKIAYNEDKYYFDSGKLDSVTNYPLMNAILEYIKYGNLFPLQNTMAQLYSDYPEENALKLFNILSTHDTQRAISFIGGEAPQDINERAVYRMENKIYKSSIERMKLAAALQVFLPGIPCIYYGDEIGMEGFEDPFNRMPMRWNDVSDELLGWYKTILKIRKENRPLWEGGLEVKYCKDKILVFDRIKDKETIRVFLNLSDEKLTFKNTKGLELISQKQEKEICLNRNECKVMKLYDAENIFPRS